MSDSFSTFLRRVRSNPLDENARLRAELIECHREEIERLAELNEYRRTLTVIRTLLWVIPDEDLTDQERVIRKLVSE